MIKPMTSVLFRATLMLLTLVTLTFTSSPVSAAQNHDMHNAAMSQEMMHEHIRDCAAACGVVDRSENRKINVNQRKKQKEVEPKSEPLWPTDFEFQYPEYKYRNVFIEQKNDNYLRYAQLRL